MRIGIVLSKPPSYSETFFNNKIKGLEESGINVCLFVQNNPNNYRLCPVIVAPKVTKGIIGQGLKSFIVFLGLLPYLQRVIKFVKLEKKTKRSWSQIIKNIYNNAHLLKADLEWVHFGFATMALQSENVAQAISSKMALSLRGYDVAIYPNKHPECYKTLWEKVDKVHYISNDLLLKAYNLGLQKEKTAVKITPAINVSFFKKDKNVRNLNREHLQFLTVARLHWKKGLIDTLEALAVLKKKGVSFTYTIAGDGDDYERLSYAIFQLGLTKEVVFVGKKEPVEVVHLMTEADIYLQYSVSEGFCNAVLEAQALGVLCIVSNAEGLMENVLDGETGWVVSKNKPLLLAKKVLEILEFPNEKLDSIKQNALLRVNKDFNLNKQQDEFYNFYFRDEHIKETH